MVFRKQIPAGSTGTANEFGGDDINVYDKFLSGTDVTASITGPTNINTPVEWESGKLSIGNGTNANKITLTSSAQSGSYNINIPVLSGNIDLPVGAGGGATLGANTFTDIQTVSKDAQRLIKMYRPINTANTTTGFEFQFQNSATTQTTFAYILGKLITNTAGAEDSSILISTAKAGSINTVMTIDKSGMVTIGSGQNIAVGGFMKNSGVNTTTASSSTEFDVLNYSVPANLLGANGSLRVRVAGYCLQNQATATDFTWKIKFGTTTIYQDAILAVAQSSVNRPWVWEFMLGNKNATNTQGCIGTYFQNDTNAVTTGEGTINDDEETSTAAFRTTDPAKDTTSSQTLQITMTHSVNNASVSTTVTRQTIEFIPGI